MITYQLILVNIGQEFWLFGYARIKVAGDGLYKNFPPPSIIHSANTTSGRNGNVL